MPQLGHRDVCGGNSWCVGGPFVGWQHSTDRGKSWTVPTAINSSHNIFGQPWPRPPAPFQFKVQQVRWVDFGKNNEHSPDGAHYLLAHGCNGTAGYNCTWTQGSHLYLLRILHLSPLTVNDLAAWEFWAGPRRGWSTDFADLEPTLAWPNRLGPAAISWVGGAVNKFVLVVGTPTVGLEMSPTLDTWIAEADALTGPYRLVQYLPAFGNQGYNPNSPAKFWAGGLNSTGWLWYSAMWTHDSPAVKPEPPFCNITTNDRNPWTSRGSCYGSVAAEIQLVSR